LKSALQRVSTPYVLVHQHDDVIVKNFDLTGCMQSMTRNAGIKHIHFARYRNHGRHSGEMATSWDGPVDAVVHGGSDVPLTRCFGWSDYCHITSVEYLRTFVLPRCGHGFMETFLQPLLKDAMRGKNLAEVEASHREFGTYLYGDLSDGEYVRHTDGSRR
jgi:hypothetical protein